MCPLVWRSKGSIGQECIPDELLWHILSGAKVARRIEWQRRNRVPAVSIVSVLEVDTADGEKSPTGGIASVGDSANVAGFEEVKLVLRIWGDVSVVRVTV